MKVNKGDDTELTGILITSTYTYMYIYVHVPFNKTNNSRKHIDHYHNNVVCDTIRMYMYIHANEDYSDEFECILII